MQPTLQPNHSLLHLEKEEDQAGNNQQPFAHGSAVTVGTLEFSLASSEGLCDQAEVAACKRR